MFHAATERWLHLSLDVSPTARHDHVAAFDDTGRSLLIHGGWDGFRVFRDLWTFDVDAQRWSLLDTGNSGPSARHDHVAVFDPTKRRLWIHGGGVISEEGFNDLWTFDVPRLQWSQVASGSGPSRCWGHVAAWDGSHGEVWVHGGWSSGELWKFNVANNHWSLQGRSPTQMWEHVGAFVATNATPILWLHGGRNLGGVSSAELWQFQSLEVECLGGQELFSWNAISSLRTVDWWSSGAGMTFFSVLCLMLVALISSCVTDRMLWQRLRTAQLDGRWAPPKDGSKTKRSTAEVQVGFLGFVAHSAHQILGHVQAAQLRVLPADLQKVIDYVFDASTRKGKEGEFLEKELGNRASRQKYNQLAEDFLQRGCFVFLWRWMILFGSIHPWNKACCLSFYISHASRVALAVNQLLTASALTVAAYASSSFHRSLHEGCISSRSLQDKILAGTYMGLLSWLVMLLPVIRQPGLDGRCVMLSLVIFAILQLFLSLFCIYLTVIFLGNVSQIDAGDWLFTWIVALIVALMIGPLLLALSLDAFLGVFVMQNPASTQQIKMMRQVNPTDAVASIWDGDILDLAPIRLGREVQRPPTTGPTTQHAMSVSELPVEDEEEPGQCEVAASMVEVTLCPQLSCWEAAAPQQRVRVHFASSD